MFRALVPLVIVGCASSSRGPTAPPPGEGADGKGLARPDETHLRDVVQLTRDAGENAEAYWKFDDRELIFQSSRPPQKCDQIYRVPADGATPPRMVSSGKGRTTCSYFFPAGDRILYASTHLGGDACPPDPDHSQGYVWAIYDSYDVFSAKADGSELVRLTDAPGYDAEATICGRDGSILFTSVRDGDLELYRMDADGRNLKRLTSSPGYDGGAFFSADCSKIVWRASRPTGDALADYQRLLGQGLVRPSKLELWVANADGSEPRQVTYLDAASFGPYFYPDGNRIIFSSNYGDERGREFDLWAVNVDGTELERITTAPGFDGFPMFSHAGDRLAWGSNRNQARDGQTDVYVARWEAGPPRVQEPRAADRIKTDVTWLADDAREGRGLGTPGLLASAAYIEARFRALGLEPAFADGSYRQAVDAVVEVKRGAATAVALDGAALAADAFVPASASASTLAEGAVVAAGHGITAPELGIDDYRGVRAKGKIVVVRRFVPAAGGGGKPFDAEAERRYGDLRYKAWNAREHGAIGLIVIDVPAGAGAAAEEAPLPALTLERHGDAGVPIVVVKRVAGEKLLRGRHRARIEVALERRSEAAFNVGARLPGRRRGAVVIGAHYDHLGMGAQGSLAHGEPPAAHVGADDNASGTAALLEVARMLAEGQPVERDIYFVAFTAEEAGVLGSSAFVRAPPPGIVPADTVAMLNMDMVGRMRENRLQILGGESAEEWKAIVEPACVAARVECGLGGDGYGPSDHTPFYAAGIPVLHFFTGAHREYHRPSDRADLLSYAGTERVAVIVADVARRLAGRDERLTLRKAPAPAPSGDVRSYGASMGTIPDYADPTGQPGVLLAGARPGGPAEKAGIRRGDRLVKIGSHRIANIQDMMFVLRQSKPGQTVPVVVVRDGTEVTVQLTFGQSTGAR